MIIAAIIVIFVISMICQEKGRIDARNEFRERYPELLEKYKEYFKF